MIPKGPALYRINLIRELREREKKAEKQRSFTALVGIVCFGFFILSLLYSALTIWKMENVLSGEKIKLAHLKSEYTKYKETKLIVDKTDIEMLNELQGRGILWTKKLVSIAKHLPEDYSISRFSYTNNELHVFGQGFVSQDQEQLLVLDAFLNRLRADTTFNDIFSDVHLNSAQRQADNAGKIAFDFTAYTKNGGKK